jgi:predicted ATP-grasp superfamily ATP-dependent carboligase
VEWLLAFGAREGRHVLYPTSDEVAYLLAAHRDALADRFALYQPDLDATLAVLDKKRLLDAASAAGLDTPETTYPRDLDEVERAAATFDGPVMLKPRTQILLRHHRKGTLAPQEGHALRAAYDSFARDHVYEMPIAADRDLTRPMLQRYYAEAASWIYSVAGFRDRDTGRVAMKGAVKVLQRPRRLGVGLCFESAPVTDGVAAGVTAMLGTLGYFGVFEIEFVRAGDRLLLIDMNPRFYNQMALEVARGLDLPRAAYAAAAGATAELASLLEPTDDARPYAFCNSIGVRVLVGAQRALGTMTASDAARWRSWASGSERTVVDAVAADDDPVPFAVEAARQVLASLRHPRAFLRMTALDR